jgi:sarcosine oxidase gamma subunit
MTPAQAIGALDRQLARHGEEILVMRGTSEQVMRAMVRSFKPSELAGLLRQGDRSVVVSPTGFGVLGIPQAQDKLKTADALVTVIAVEPVRLAGVIVRANLVVRGD